MCRLLKSSGLPWEDHPWHTIQNNVLMISTTWGEGRRAGGRERGREGRSYQHGLNQETDKAEQLLHVGEALATAESYYHLEWRVKRRKC